MKKEKKNGADAYLDLFVYRNTPTQGLDTSPAPRLMNRRTNALLPTSPALLQPKVAEQQHSRLLADQGRQAHY